jgi:hypothetical protein
VTERLSELEARRSSLQPLSAFELAVAANLIALATVQLAKDAASHHLPLPTEAMDGTRQLHEWARTVLAQHGIGSEQPAAE